MFNTKRKLIEEIAELNLKIEDLRKTSIDLLDANDRLSDEAATGRRLSKTVPVIIQERDELKKLVREQTQADILYKALKESGCDLVSKPASQESIEARQQAISDDKKRFMATLQRAASQNWYGYNPAGQSALSGLQGF